MRITNILTLFIILVVTAIDVQAIPSKPGIWKTITLADGTTVTAEMRGDEYVCFWQSADSMCYMLRDEAYCKVSYEEISRLARERRAANFIFAQAETSHSHKSGRAATVTNAVTGKKKGLVILVEFSDLAFSMDDPLGYFNRFSNERGFYNGKGEGSVSDYFTSQSGGLFELNFDIVGPIKLPHTQKYYGANKDGSDDYEKLYEFVAGALGQANSLVNWSDYDWYGDGYVDQVFFIYAGNGAADSGKEDTIWPHEFSLRGLGQRVAGAGPIKYGDVTIDTYACSCELNGSNVVSGIGTMCHEFSHCLGIPDLYDAEYTGRIYGMGAWDLMHSGSYNNGGYCPPNFTSWEKMRLGWLTPVELKGDMAINGMKSLSDNGNAYIIYNEGHNDEYYLLENRQKKGWDKSLPGQGLLILHIDYDKYYFGSTFRGPNTMAGNNDHARVSIFHADNKETDNDESDDPYPYGNVNSLADNTIPASKVYNRNNDGTNFMHCNINQITQNNDGTISFIYGNAMAADSTILLSESFNKCEGTGANDGNWLTFKTGTAKFVPDVDGWSCSQMGGAFHCGKFGSSAINATVTSPTILFTGKATMTFRAAPYVNEGEMKLRLWSNNPNIVINPSIIQLTEKEWTDISVEISGVGLGAIVFSPDCRLYLDEINVRNNDISAIGYITTTQNAISSIYNISGQRVGEDYRGIVIINGKKIHR